MGENASSQYYLVANRKNSGIDGYYPSMDAAIERLKSYGQSFPDEVIEATITKIK